MTNTGWPGSGECCCAGGGGGGGEECSAKVVAPMQEKLAVAPMRIAKRMRRMFFMRLPHIHYRPVGSSG